MNQTRKEIIGFIEPFMDKGLSEGCMIKTNYGIPGDNSMSDDMTDRGYMIDSLRLQKDTGVLEFENIDGGFFSFNSFEEIYKHSYNINDYGNKYLFMEYNVLGHYDITAVFTYITQNHGDYKSNKTFEDSIDILDCYREVIGVIQNKPLHLYSEKEEKALLEIFNKLYPNNN